MALSPNINNREFDKFIDDPDGVYGTMVKVFGRFASGSVNIQAPTGPFRISTHQIGLTAVNPLSVLGPLTSRVSLSFRNKGPGTLYFYQDNTVTADNSATGGWEIGPNEDFNIDLDSDNLFYLLSDQANTFVKILEIAST